MARGWESKAVADQIDEKTEGERPETATHADASAEARRLHDRIESLRMSRARTLEQLERATNARHREMLRRALLTLEREMEQLG